MSNLKKKKIYRRELEQEKKIDIFILIIQNTPKHSNFKCFKKYSKDKSKCLECSKKTPKHLS